MKRVFLLVAIAGALLTSCMKDPNFDDLSSDFVVTTSYNSAVNFKTGYNGTYYLPDTVIYISGDNPSTYIVQYWTMDNQWVKANPLLSEIETNMTSLGYTRTKNFSDVENGTADLSMNIVISEATNLAVWYPGWWDPYWWYWDGWYPPYYPWYPVYTYYKTGAEIINLLDLKNATTAQDGSKQPSAIWSTTSFGALYSDPNFNASLLLNAIDQGFSQSPYLDRK